MLTPTTGGFIIHKIPAMEGFPYALKFFDDDRNLYASPVLMEQIAKGKTQVRYLVMSWRRDQKTIEQAIDAINAQLIRYITEMNAAE